MDISELIDRYSVWVKGVPLQDQTRFPSHEWRMDVFGNVMRNSHYGDRTSAFGWEIDHVVPSAFGGANTHDNKRPLHWRANVGLGGIARALLNPVKR